MEYNLPSELIKELNFGESANKRRSNRCPERSLV